MLLPASEVQLITKTEQNVCASKKIIVPGDHSLERAACPETGCQNCQCIFLSMLLSSVTKTLWT